MSLIKLPRSQGERYQRWLAAYRNLTGKEPGAIERTEAFFCSRSSDPWMRPHWVC